MLVIAAALMFALVFVRALIAFARTRDRLHGAVALVFAPVGALFLLQVVRIVTGQAVSGPLRLAALVLLVGQPMFTLALVALIRRMSRIPILAAFAGWVAVSAFVATTPSPLPRSLTLIFVGYFVTGQFVAAGYLTTAGLLRRIQPSGSVARYETRVGDNHHHVVCRSCGTIADVDCAVEETPCLTASDDHGFVIDEAEVVYWGTCPQCAAEAARATG